MHFLKIIFTWWHNQTLGTWLTTWRRGKLVGVDEQGNRYYEDRAGASVNGKTRRWVIYNGDIEATRVAPEWHGWLHYTVDETPEQAAYVRRDWHQPHRRNMTGTKDAHKPAGPADSTSYPKGYSSWTPE
ncbi:MAG: NADH:ubiquinone oxidoreductase subunit NDUFA12 [Parvibaculales bacterium]